MVKTKKKSELITDRRSADRRASSERRKKSEEESNFAGTEHRKSPRRKIERRRQVDPTTCERDYDDEEVEFMTSMDEYKRRSGRMFPTWSEVLEVLRSLGYRKVAEQTEIDIQTR